MAPVKRTRQGRVTGNAASDTSLGNNTDNTEKTSGHSTQEGRVKRHEVKNKAKDIATHGTAPWNDHLRQLLLDYRVARDGWGKVCEILGRSNQAVRSEFKKMKDGVRNVAEGVDWQQKALACNQQRIENPPPRQARPSSTTTTLGDSTTSANSTTRTPESYMLSPTRGVAVDSPTMPAEEDLLEASSDTVSLGHGNLTAIGDRTYLDTSSLATTSDIASVSHIRADSSQSAVHTGEREDEDEDEEDDIAYKQRYTYFVAPPKKKQLKATDFHPTDYWVYGRTIEEEPERKTKPSRYFFRKEGCHRDEEGTLFYDHPWGFSRLCFPEGYHDREEHEKLCPLTDAQRDEDLLAFTAVASG